MSETNEELLARIEYLERAIEDLVREQRRAEADSETELHEAYASLDEAEALLRKPPQPCRDGFHYIDVGLCCRYCGERDNGVMVNYATIDPYAITMPPPLRAAKK